MATLKTKLRNSSKAHTIYRLPNGRPVPGVTSVTGLLAKPALMPWSNQLGLDGIEYKTYLDNTAQAGTCGHLIVSSRLKGVTAQLDQFTAIQIEAGTNAANHFFEWWGKRQCKVIASEIELVSTQFEFGGCVDLVAEVDGVKELIDLKTGSGIYPEMYIQAAAYTILAEENGFGVQQARILNIPREVKNPCLDSTVPMIEKQQELFLALLRVYNIRKELGQ